MDVSHWSIGAAIAKLRSDVNTLTWLLAETRYLHGACIITSVDTTTESPSADTEQPAQGPLDGGSQS